MNSSIVYTDDTLDPEVQHKLAALLNKHGMVVEELLNKQLAAINVESPTTNEETKSRMSSCRYEPLNMVGYYYKDTLLLGTRFAANNAGTMAFKYYVPDLTAPDMDNVIDL